MKACQFFRITHRWGALIIAIPLGIVIVTGIILQLKKEFSWIQPPTAKGTGNVPSLSFDQILEVAKTVPDAGIEGWKDIDRLDVRPDKGSVKVRVKNRWEIQLDADSGEILQVAYRRSDLIESIHDGRFFHEKAKLWLFLPAGLILALLWATGMYLFLLPYLVKRRRRKKNRSEMTSF